VRFFPSDFALYPTLPRFDARQAFSLLGVSILVLFLVAGEIAAGRDTRAAERILEEPLPG